MLTRTGFLMTVAVLLGAPLARAGDIVFFDPTLRPAADLAPVMQQQLDTSPATKVTRQNPFAALGDNPEFFHLYEPREAGNKNPYRLNSKSGLRLNVDGQRPHLEYRFDNNVIMRVRATRDSVRVIGRWDF